MREKTLLRGLVFYWRGPKLGWRPHWLLTADDPTSPFVARLFWRTYCLGWLKPEWEKPMRLSRQLRRQLARKGRLVLMGPKGLVEIAAACVLIAVTLAGCAPALGQTARAPASPASAASPSSGPSYCFTPDAVLALAIFRYKSSKTLVFEPGELDMLYLRASLGHLPCSELGGGEERAAIAAERRREDATRRAVEDALYNHYRLRGGR
jgi:hypothetical protein